MTNKNRGFTLLEILVTTVILSSLLLISSLSFSYFSERWSKLQAQVIQAKINAKRATLLHGLFEHIADTYLKNENGIPKLFFKGGQDYITAITTEPLSGNGNYSLTHFEVKREDDGHYSIVYKEWQILDYGVYEFTEIEKLLNTQPQYKAVLVDNLTVASFRFLRVDSFQAFLGGNAKNYQEQDVYHHALAWEDSHSGIEIGVLPRRVEWQFTTGEEQSSYLFEVPLFNSFKQTYMVFDNG